jgi:hypothetical protein
MDAGRSGTGSDTLIWSVTSSTSRFFLFGAILTCSVMVPGFPVSSTLATKSWNSSESSSWVMPRFCWTSQSANGRITGPESSAISVSSGGASLDMGLLRIGGAMGHTVTARGFPYLRTAPACYPAALPAGESRWPNHARSDSCDTSTFMVGFLAR